MSLAEGVSDTDHRQDERQEEKSTNNTQKKKEARRGQVRVSVSVVIEMEKVYQDVVVRNMVAMFYKMVRILTFVHEKY